MSRIEVSESQRKIARFRYTECMNDLLDYGYMTSLIIQPGSGFIINPDPEDSYFSDEEFELKLYNTTHMGVEALAQADEIVRRHNMHIALGYGNSVVIISGKAHPNHYRKTVFRD